MTFGDTLQELRRAKGKTQREVAALVGMDYGYFSRIENDRFDYKPSRDTVEKIADALECNEEERGALLAAAGRIDEEIEQLARTAQKRPELRRLFRSAAQLSPQDLELINVWVEESAQKDKSVAQKRKK